jgi:diguanylate cyclase with GGDEF domain
MTISTALAADGHVTHYVGSFADFTQQKEAEAKLHRLPFYDPLTELPNRRLLLARLRQAFAASARSRQHGAILFIDLDHFKTLNDTKGHDVGDQLLTQVVVRLPSSMRGDDSIARLGGVGEARQQLASYFAFYNSQRPRSSPGGITPDTGILRQSESNERSVMLNHCAGLRVIYNRRNFT